MARPHLLEGFADVALPKRHHFVLEFREMLDGLLLGHWQVRLDSGQSQGEVGHDG